MIKSNLRGRRSPRYTPEQRNEMLEAYFKHEALGVPREDIARDLNVSLASIYRWQHQSLFRARKAISSRAASNLDLEEAIKNLAQPVLDDRLFLTSLFKFIVWMRWPSDDEYHLEAVTSCAAGYLSQKFGPICPMELDLEWQRFLFCNLKLDVLSRTCSADAVTYPCFGHMDIEDYPYTTGDVLAEVTKFLIDNEGLQPANAKPTLTRAYQYISTEARYPWEVSERTFQDFWRKHGPTAPFWYVSVFHSGLDWPSNPTDVTFAAEADQLLQQRDTVTEYFALCRQTCKRLSARLSPQTARRVKFPTFPEEYIDHLTG